jgi:DNA helicase HerA-like ATPase
VNPNEAPDLATARMRLGLPRGYNTEGTSTRIFRLATCDSKEEIVASFSGQAANIEVVSTGAPVTLPRAGDPVVLLPSHLAQASFGGLPSDDEGLSVGQTVGGMPVDVMLTPQILQMHVGVFGTPGKGKSYLTGVLMEETARWDVPILAIDLNGEFIEAAKALGGLVIRLPNRELFGLTLSLLTPRELVSITPNVMANTAYAELIEISHDRLKTDTPPGEEITFQQLNDKMVELGRSLEMKPLSISAAQSRIRALSNDDLILSSGSSFDFIAALKMHKIVVLDCRYLTIRRTQLIAAAAARRLQTYGRTMARRANDGDRDAAAWFATLFIDEAHAVAPNSENVVSSQVLNELSRMGRHVRTGLILASQSPADLDRAILKKLQTRFIFAIERDQLSAIGGVSADLGVDLQAQLPKLPRGICAVSGTSELIRHGFMLKVRPRVTPVGGGTPPVFTMRTKRPLGV